MVKIYMRKSANLTLYGHTFFLQKHLFIDQKIMADSANFLEGTRYIPN